MNRIIALAADHGGFPLKVELAPWLRSQGYEISDLGAHSLDPDDDYPDFAEATAREVVSGRAERGIVICGSGVGASVAANKVPGIRACLCHDVYSAHQGVAASRHSSNPLRFGVPWAVAWKLQIIWLWQPLQLQGLDYTVNGY